MIVKFKLLRLCLLLGREPFDRKHEDEAIDDVAAHANDTEILQNVLGPTGRPAQRVWRENGGGVSGGAMEGGEEVAKCLGDAPGRTSSTKTRTSKQLASRSGSLTFNT